MCLGYLRANSGEFLYRDEFLATLTRMLKLLRCYLAKTGDSHKRRTDFTIISY